MNVVYLKMNQNIAVEQSVALLEDFATVYCNDVIAKEHIKKLQIFTLEDPKKCYIISVLKLIETIKKHYPEMEIHSIGETDCIIQTKDSLKQNKAFEIIKVILICLILFFGSSFTIMTFHNDVGVPDIFASIYEKVTGESSDGSTIIELTYSFGLGIGILVFFNHIGRKKITKDPTPIQVEMRKYESDVDRTFIENANRNGTEIDVD